MTKTIRVSDEYHEVLKAHNREEETMEETLRRVVGGPDPRVVAGVLDEQNAARMEEAIENLRGRDRDSRRRLRTAFQDEDADEQSLSSPRSSSTHEDADE